MAQFRSIDIDFDIHKIIESNRESFSETPNDVLRRILQLGQPSTPVEMTSNHQRRSWSGKGVTLPHGTQLRMRYNGKTHTGKVVDGTWIVEGRAFSSPSGAASEVGVTKKGGKTKLDGWKNWEFKPPGSEVWTPLASKRPQVTLKDLGLDDE